MGRKKKTLVRQPDPPSKWPRWTGFRGKTAWDWMQLLIVPLVLTVLGLSFAIAQQVISDLQQELRQQQIEEQRAAAERDIADLEASKIAAGEKPSQAALEATQAVAAQVKLRCSEFCLQIFCGFVFLQAQKASEKGAHEQKRRSSPDEL